MFSVSVGYCKMVIFSYVVQEVQNNVLSHEKNVFFNVELEIPSDFDKFSMSKTNTTTTIK